jgi:hypothetical protein
MIPANLTVRILGCNDTRCSIASRRASSTMPSIRAGPQSFSPTRGTIWQSVGGVFDRRVLLARRKGKHVPGQPPVRF